MPGAEDMIQTFLSSLLLIYKNDKCIHVSEYVLDPKVTILESEGADRAGQKPKLASFP